MCCLSGTGSSNEGYDASRAQPGSRDQSLNGEGMLGPQPLSREQSANAHGILDTGQSQAAMLPQAGSLLTLSKACSVSGHDAPQTGSGGRCQEVDPWPLPSAPMLAVQVPVFLCGTFLVSLRPEAAIRLCLYLHCRMGHCEVYMGMN